MKLTRGIILSAMVFIWLLHFNIAAQPVIRIMPMGNSITYDENSLDGSTPRPAGERISYRYKLYQLISAAGYAFDFTGSENSGNDFFDNTELDDNAGFPGIEKAGLVSLLNTGINPVTGLHVSPGPYLQTYSADIILLHIGTNNLTVTSGEVGSILDRIRAYNSEVFILVARIINRGTYSSTTTTFNNNVEAMVNARGDARIKMVNMETGAGINYSTDMIDNLHPNQSGYDKMAIKWFEAINNLNQDPVISDIPTQVTLEGTVFPELSLDGYVSDAEDSDNLITWTFTQQSVSNLSVTLDANRILHVSPVDNDWNGTELIKLKAEDTGSGTFIKTDSVDVVFTVQPGNDPPAFTSTPVSIADEDSTYTYTVTANDIDVGDEISYSAPVLPSWLSFDPSTHVLSGIPSNDNVGISNITVRISDGTIWVDQPFQITVMNTNDRPVITSDPVLSDHVNEVYLYEITATDIDPGDLLVFSAETKPDWLEFSAGSTSGILNGIPSQTDIGTFTIILHVSDGHVDVAQEYTITVSGPSDIPDIDQNTLRDVYPNPAHDLIYFRAATPTTNRIEIYDIMGNLRMQTTVEKKDMIEINISVLPKGIYFYKFRSNNKVSVGKFIRN